MKLSDIKVDAARIEDGAWIGDIPELGDLRLKVRGLGNADYRRRQAELVAAVPRARRRAEQDRIMVQVLHETVLLDWENVTGDDGGMVPYDKAMALRLLSEPEYRAFHDGVMWAAAAVAETQAEDIEADEKN